MVADAIVMSAKVTGTGSHAAGHGRDRPTGDDIKAKPREEQRFTRADPARGRGDRRRLCFMAGHWGALDRDGSEEGSVSFATCSTGHYEWQSSIDTTPQNAVRAVQKGCDVVLVAAPGRKPRTRSAL